MKTAKSQLGICIAIAALVSGCEATVEPYYGAEVAVAPAPVVFAPDYYVWDGYEYVGDCDGRYVYLDPGGVWVVCDPIRIERFNGWVGVHPDWRRSAVRYDRGHRPEQHLMRRPPARESGRRDGGRREERREER